VSGLLWALTATELVAGYRTGALSPVAVLAAIRDRFDAVNAAINAIIATDWAAAERSAAQSEGRWRAGASLSPLDGVPVTIKDNLHAAGLPAGWGSVAYAGFVPEADEPPISRLRAAGAIFLGKTNVPEFTLQGYTSNRVFGTTCNPHAPDRTPGGSTGGGAAAVAAGLGPIAIGTDGGGSLRRPAAHCGLFALKPSIGQIGRSGGFAQILSDFEVVGPVARSLEDLCLTFAHLRGLEPSDPRSLVAPAPEPGYRAAPRIGYFRDIGDLPVDPRILTAADAFAAALAAEGCAVSPIGAPFDPAAINTIWGTVAAVGIAWHLAKLGDIGSLGANAVAMAETGATKSASDYVEALAGAAHARLQAAALFEDFDLLLCPAIAALAWPADDPFPPEIDGRPAGPRGHAIFTAWMNVAGLPAISLPVAMTADAGGIGMQLVAASGRDHALLSFCTTSPSIRALSPARLSERI